MKKFGIWAVAAALFFAPMGLSSCSMGSSASEMKGSLNFTQDDLTEKPFKAIDVDVIASVYYTQNNGDECRDCSGTDSSRKQANRGSSLFICCS